MTDDIASAVERVQCMRSGERVIFDTQRYSNVGLGIKCVIDAWMKAQGERTNTGIPLQCTEAGKLMLTAMRAIDASIDTGYADMDAPCFTCADGSDPYYTPVQYLCVLSKCLWPGQSGWASDLAMKMHSKGAHYEPDETWTTDMKDYARTFLKVVEVHDVGLVGKNIDHVRAVLDRIQDTQDTIG